MRKVICLGLFLIILSCVKVNAQIQVSTKATVSGVTFYLVGDKVYIKYDILNSRKSDLFNVQVKAFNEIGEEIIINSISGDLENVSPGINRRIIWDIGKDIFEINDRVYIEVYAELLTPNIIQPITKKKAYLLSTLYPGLGTYKLTNDKYHLIKGLISYGLAVTSVKSHLKSKDYYNEYLDSEIKSERSSLYDNSIDKQKFANACAIGALSVWLIEYVNIYFAKNKILQNNVELGLKMDNFSGQPLFSLNLKL